MDKNENLLKYKIHILSVAAFALLILSACYLAPRFIDIVYFFWPLLGSTALFLVAVVVLSKISPQAAESAGEKAGESLLDYVASEPEHVQSTVEEAEGGAKI